MTRLSELLTPIEVMPLFEDMLSVGSSGVVNIDMAAASTFYTTLTGDITFNFDLTNLPTTVTTKTKGITLNVTQDSTFRTWTFTSSSGSVLFADNTVADPPEINAKATLTAFRDENGDVRVGLMGANFL